MGSRKWRGTVEGTGPEREGSCWGRIWFSWADIAAGSCWHIWENLHGEFGLDFSKWKLLGAMKFPQVSLLERFRWRTFIAGLFEEEFCKINPKLPLHPTVTCNRNKQKLLSGSPHSKSVNQKVDSVESFNLASQFHSWITQVIVILTLVSCSKQGPKKAGLFQVWGGLLAIKFAIYCTKCSTFTACRALPTSSSDNFPLGHISRFHQCSATLECFPQQKLRKLVSSDWRALEIE